MLSLIPLGSFLGLARLIRRSLIIQLMLITVCFTSVTWLKKNDLIPFAAEEIENLRQEARALKEIRESMGSDEFPKKVFDKVFNQDINRLREMEDMWKSRKAPEPLDFESLDEALSNVDSGVSSSDQRIWTLSENFAVFKDRFGLTSVVLTLDLVWFADRLSSLDRLSQRIRTLQLEDGKSQAILNFDKDDVDTLDFVTAGANLRANIFEIELKSKFDTKRMSYYDCLRCESLILGLQRWLEISYRQ